MLTKDKLICRPENVAKYREWLATRGGLAVWKSINFSNLGTSWTTPARTADGQPTPKPTWEADSAPARVVTSEDDVDVVVDKEVKRFRVGVRRGSSNPCLIKVTDGGSRRIRKAVAAAGDGAYHVFDYETQEAVILAPEKRVPLREWRDG